MESGSGPGSPSTVPLAPSEAVPGPADKGVSIFLVLFVCMVGIVGNAMVVLVVLTTRDMQMLTNCYVVSLALADLTVLVAAGMPTVSESLAGQWVYGHASCLGITYLQYLGINASSCSILAFTVERYIAICHPMWAQTVCTMVQAKRVVVGVWGTMSVYCLLWFFLVDLDAGGSRGLQCGYQVACSLYLPIYLLDFTVFFLAPLLAATVLSGLIARVLFRSTLAHLPQLGDQHRDSEAQLEARALGRQPREPGGGAGASCCETRGFPSSRKQVTKMLVVVVLPFTVLWMPYRSLLLLNSFVSEPFLDPRVLLFCRTCVYANSAVNPIIYSLMSQKFQAAFRQLCQCRAEGPQRRMASLSTASYSAVRETPQKAETSRSEAAGPQAAGPPLLQQGPGFSMV
ncbi:thyrotropin-releasing hormone receptor-like [Odocoileus virginianus]|uniref:Thyrotropin-releasing hormone receptor n=1 Tax=Odocoileus virginianus TaxID=9874 RepID=A0A6J0Z2A7_ODOVR